MLPFFFGYSVTRSHSATFDAHSEDIRLLLFSFSQSASGGDSRRQMATRAALSPHTWTNVAGGLGPIAIKISLVSLILALPNRRLAILASAGALALGAYNALQGFSRN